MKIKLLSRQVYKGNVYPLGVIARSFSSVAIQSFVNCSGSLRPLRGLVMTSLIVLKFLSLAFFLFTPSLCYGELLNQLSSSKDDVPVIIEAEESVVCDETALKCVATGLASAQKGTSIVYGDVLTVYFTEGKKREITSMTADGHVRMETPTEKAYGEHAHYDVALDRVILTGGDLKIVTPKETLTARDSIEYYHKENKGIARGNAVAKFPDKEQLVQADTLVAYFKPASEKAKEGEDKLNLERVEAEGNLLASGPKGVVTGDRGTYTEKATIIEVFNNVKITQAENVIEGEYAKFNMETNVAEMYTQPPHVAQTGPKKRIHGMIIPSSTKKENGSTKTSDKGKSKHGLPF